MGNTKRNEEATVTANDVWPNGMPEFGQTAQRSRKVTARDIELDECLRLFAAMAEELTERERTMDAVRRHRDIIARFGRYPHRNAVLGRPSTPEEEAFLREPNSPF